MLRRLIDNDRWLIHRRLRLIDRRLWLIDRWMRLIDRRRWRRGDHNRRRLRRRVDRAWVWSREPGNWLVRNGLVSGRDAVAWWWRRRRIWPAHTQHLLGA